MASDSAARPALFCSEPDTPAVANSDADMLNEYYDERDAIVQTANALLAKATAGSLPAPKNTLPYAAYF